MRRGLMAWDADELPLDALKARLQRLQVAMAERRQDALLLYTNFIRSGAVSYITAFSPYWADGVLLVPKRGPRINSGGGGGNSSSRAQGVKPCGAV